MAKFRWDYAIHDDVTIHISNIDEHWMTNESGASIWPHRAIVEVGQTARGSNRYYLRTKDATRHIVLDLKSSHKGEIEDFIVVRGNWQLGPGHPDSRTKLCLIRAEASRLPSVRFYFKLMPSSNAFLFVFFTASYAHTWANSDWWDHHINHTHLKRVLDLDRNMRSCSCVLSRVLIQADKLDIRLVPPRASTKC
ncbi:hypothetical protein U1Q18_049150 [Sarracenia purpurea var. burkii]